MSVINNFLQMSLAVINKYQNKLVNIFFLIFIASFFIDRMLFSFIINFPFFVVSALLIFPFLFLVAQYKNPNKYQLYALVFYFVIITILSSIIYFFGVQNISDLLFIILFITIYFYYKENIMYLKISNVYVFLILSLFLFSFTFFNINSDSSPTRIAKYSSYFSSSVPVLKKQPPIKEVTKNDLTNKKNVASADKLHSQAGENQKKLSKKRNPYMWISISRLMNDMQDCLGELTWLLIF